MDAVHGNLSHAMRDNYNEHGVDEYYRKVAATYRNPFFPGIKKVIWTFMNRWWEAEGMEIYVREGHDGRRSLKVLDMAAGSGEATLCLLEWAQTSLSSSSTTTIPSPGPSQQPSAAPNTSPDPLAMLRSNPPLPNRPAFLPTNARRLVARPGESASGPRGKQVSGGMVPPTLPKGFELDIVATDPYTSPAYTDRTSRPCHPLSFTDLARGQTPPPLPNVDPEAAGEPVWDIIICSFALHLVASPSELFALMYELSNKARWFIVVAPHKKPDVKETWGWSRWDIASWTAAGEAKLYAGQGRGEVEDELETELEIVRDKVKLRLYRSNAF